MWIGSQADVALPTVKSFMLYPASILLMEMKIYCPVGMVGSRLEVETHIVTINNATLQNVIKCCERAGFHPWEIVVNGYASGEAVLFPAEKELGAVVVDIGGGTTDIALFDQGTLWYTAVLPWVGITSLVIWRWSAHSTESGRDYQKGAWRDNFLHQHLIVNLWMFPVWGRRPLGYPKSCCSIIEPRVQEILTRKE